MAITFTPISADPSDVLDEVVACLLEYTQEHGKPTIITGARTYTAQLERLTLEMAQRALGDCDMGDFIRLYQRAELIEGRGHSYTIEEADNLELISDDLRQKARQIGKTFDNLASRIHGRAA